MSAPILTCRALTVGYDGVRLCSGIDFTLHEGEYLSVIGPVGCGKSALVATGLGIIPPIEGEVGYENGLTRTEIGCLPQQNDVRGSVSVRDLVLSGCLGHMRHIMVGRAEKALAADAMERLGISDLARRRFGDLSGGQKQRALLARALCGARRLLILDDPMRGLDPFARDALFAEIARIRDEEGVAMILVDNEAVDGTVLHMSDTVRFCGPVEEYARSGPGRLYFAGRVL